jgi:hypothetical protein
MFRRHAAIIRQDIVTCIRFPWLNNVSTAVTTLRFLRYATILGGLASLSSNNVISSIVTHATKDTETLLWFSNFDGYNSVCWNPLEWRRGLTLKSRSSTDVLVCRAMDSFWLEDWVRIGKFRERSTRVYTVDDEDIRSSGLVQVNDGLHAEVPLWCASGPIARRWIVPTCVWRLSDCKNVGSCWKIATWGPVWRILLELVFRDRAGRTCTCVRRVSDCV